MKHLAILAFIVTLVASAPTSKENVTEEEKALVINEEFFPNELKIFTAEHEIIHLLFPLNDLNFAETDVSEDESAEDNKLLFFVEADVENGIEYKGLSVFKNNIVTKILPTGTSAAAEALGNTAYFGATDGLYKYNAEKNTAEKYGPITDSIIDIAKENGTEVIYILTDKNELFNVTENGTKKDRIADVVGAKQIVLDFSNNLYYYAEDKIPYIVNADGVKKIEGLPSNPEFIKLLRPSFVIEDGVPIILDNKAYIIYVNGTSEFADIEFETKPSAYAMEATLIQYYARNKNIYEYNIIMLLLNDLVNDLKAFFADSQDEIQALATRSISNINP